MFVVLLRFGMFGGVACPPCGVAVVVLVLLCDGVLDHFWGYVLGLRCGLFLWSLLRYGVFVLLWESFVECFVGLVCSVVWCVFCVFGGLSA